MCGDGGGTGRGRLGAEEGEVQQRRVEKRSLHTGVCSENGFQNKRHGIPL